MAASAQPKFTGTKRMASAAKSSRSNASSRSERRKRRYAVCLSNKAYAASLEARKIYLVIDDSAAEEMGFLRVKDESGEDYLFPHALFAEIELPRAVAAKLSAAA
jgi:hypothetical protein